LVALPRSSLTRSRASTATPAIWQLVWNGALRHVAERCDPEKLKAALYDLLSRGGDRQELIDFESGTKTDTRAPARPLASRAPAGQVLGDQDVPRSEPAHRAVLDLDVDRTRRGEDGVAAGRVMDRVGSKRRYDDLA
jgi:hypothetical protein